MEMAVVQEIVNMHYEEYYASAAARIKDKKILLRKGKFDAVTIPIDFKEMLEKIRKIRLSPIYLWWIRVNGGNQNDNWISNLTYFIETEPELAQKCVVDNPEERRTVLGILAKLRKTDTYIERDEEKYVSDD